MKAKGLFNIIIFYNIFITTHAWIITANLLHSQGPLGPRIHRGLRPISEKE
jgi:hypothetical protein